MAKITEIKPKKVNCLDDLNKLVPGDKTFATLAISDEGNSDYMVYEGKINSKYSFMESWKIPGSPVTCWRNTFEELQFNKGQIIIKPNDHERYTIDDPREYNKRRKLMDLEEF